MVFPCTLAWSMCAPFRPVRAPRGCTTRPALHTTGININNIVRGRGQGAGDGG